MEQENPVEENMCFTGRVGLRKVYGVNFVHDGEGVKGVHGRKFYFLR